MTDIVVTGKRIRVVIGRRDRNGRPVGDDDINLTNTADAREVIAREVSEAGGSDAEIDVYVVVQIPGLNFEVIIPADEFNRLSDRQIMAMLYVFDNYGQSSQLAAALQHLHNEQISALQIHVDDQVHQPDGSSTEFRPTEMGLYPAAQIEYLSVDGDSTRTNIVQDTKVVISFNINEGSIRSAEGFVSTLIHELLHPVTPDVSFDRWYPDHRQVIPLTEQIYKTLFPGGLSSVVPLPKSVEEESIDADIQAVAAEHIERGFTNAEATALALNLNSVFGAEYWNYTKPVYVPEPFPRDRTIDE